METDKNVAAMIEALIEREGGYVNHPADKGGPTCWGITEAVARAHGYSGAMRQLPREEAAGIYRRLYWLRPRLHEVAQALGRDRRRTVRHRRQHGAGGRGHLPAAGADRAQPQWPGLSRPDARRPHRAEHACCALDCFFAARGKASGETVLLRALEALQGERYIRLAERRPANEAFLYGWLANRIG